MKNDQYRNEKGQEAGKPKNVWWNENTQIANQCKNYQYIAIEFFQCVAVDFSY